MSLLPEAAFWCNRSSNAASLPFIGVLLAAVAPLRAVVGKREAESQSGEFEMIEAARKKR